MAAINAAGYKAEWASPNNHPIRAAVQAELAKRNLASLGPLKEFFESHRKRTDAQELSQYISFALSCNGPPNFEFAMRDVEIPPDAMTLRELSRLLAAFYKEANIEDLWKRSQPAIEQYIARYHEPVTNAVLQVNGYMRQMTSGFKNRRFQIFIELQAAPNQIQTRSYSDNYTIVVTPSPDTRTFDIRHAYLHYLLYPLATRNQEILNRKKSLVDHAGRAQALSDAYKEDYLLLVTESLIKAVEARLDKKPGMVQAALSEGYILAPYFSEALPVYEKQESSMYLYYTEMMQAIDLVKEDRRLTGVRVQQAEAPGATVKVPAPAPEPAGGRAKTLQEAEQAYSSRELDKSKKLFLKTLEETDKRSVHASAYYGWRGSLCWKRTWTRQNGSSEVPGIRAGGVRQSGSGVSGTAFGSGRRARPGNGVFPERSSVEGATEKARQEAKQGLELTKKQ
jgi:hypothetical protein